MRESHRDATYIIESNARCVVTTASQEGRAVFTQGNKTLAEHYELIAYLSRLILEVVDDVTAEMQAAVKK